MNLFKKVEKKPYTYSSIEMRRSSSKLGWILIIVLGLVTLGIFLFSRIGSKPPVSPSIPASSVSVQDSSIEQSGDWKTYTSAEAIGISFQYPSNYSEIKHNSGIEVFSPVLESKQLQIKVFFEKSDKTLEKVVEDYKRKSNVSDTFNTEISGVKAIKLYWRRSDEPGGIQIKGYNSGELILFIHKGYLISINKLPLELEPQLQKVYEEVLATFKLM